MSEEDKRVLPSTDSSKPPRPQTVVDTYNLGAKFYLNGFPKSGLHLLDMMLRPLALPMPKDHRWLTPWAGMYHGNSWTRDMHPLEKMTYKMGRCQPGYFVKGHIGYVKAVERFMYYLGFIHIFIYRDLRDVAVSQAFHYKDANSEVFSHPEKELFAEMDIDDVLYAVIDGIEGKKAYYPSLLERWNDYQPWLDCDWVQSVRYEDLRHEPEEWAQNIVMYTINRMAQVLSLPGAEVDQEVLKNVGAIMAEHSQRTEISPTFREGSTGKWVEHFTPGHKKAFKMNWGSEYLIKLGYEKDNNW